MLLLQTEQQQKGIDHWNSILAQVLSIHLLRKKRDVYVEFNVSYTSLTNPKKLANS